MDHTKGAKIPLAVDDEIGLAAEDVVKGLTPNSVLFVWILMGINSKVNIIFLFNICLILPIVPVRYNTTVRYSPDTLQRF